MQAESSAPLESYEALLAAQPSETADLEELVEQQQQVHHNAPGRLVIGARQVHVDCHAVALQHHSGVGICLYAPAAGMNSSLHVLAVSNATLSSVLLVC